MIEGDEGGLYAGREQTLVKHFILRNYLERFAHIVGSAWSTIAYVDCFSGPWNNHTENLRDTSFSIAVEELRKASKHFKDAGQRDFKLRCFFLEKDEIAHGKLEQFAQTITDAKIFTKNGLLENSIDDIRKFVKAHSEAFPFFFIDPTGWTGFAMKTIAPLLCLEPGEVLINFMTGHIRRFAELDDPAVQKSLDGLFGSSDFRERIASKNGQDREDELVRSYCEAVRSNGNFKYVCPAIVLHPQIDRTHFHLIYATRHVKGVEVFKQVEEKAIPVMERTRGARQQRSRVKKSRQLEMLASDVMYNPRHLEELRKHFLAAAKQDLQGTVSSKTKVRFQDAWVRAMQFPLVWDRDVKQWIEDRSSEGLLRVEGLQGKERVPKLGAEHYLAWTGQTTRSGAGGAERQ